MPTEYGGVPVPKYKDSKPSAVLRVERRKAREAKWQKARKAVLARDGHRCRITGFGAHDGRIEVHHIKPRSLGRDDRTGNLIAACAYHHAMFKAQTIALIFLDGAKEADGPVRFEKGTAS